MTENTEQTEDTRTPERVEMDRLRAECEVWHDRCTRVSKEYSRYREDARASLKMSDQTIENLNGKIAAQQHHLEVHHRQDMRHSMEMERMRAKLDSYSSLLSLMADAGRIHPDLLDQIDAGISALHDSDDDMSSGSMPTMPSMEIEDIKLFSGKNPLKDLLTYLHEKNAEASKDDADDEPEMQTEIHPVTVTHTPTEDRSDYITPRDLNLTDAGLPKRPVKDKPQPGNDWADEDPEAHWNQ